MTNSCSPYVVDVRPEEIGRNHKREVERTHFVNFVVLSYHRTKLHEISGKKGQ